MLQIGIVFFICLVSIGLNLIIPLPATIIAMILMFILLFFGILKVNHIKESSEFLLKNMTFFFIPAGVEIMNNAEYIKDNLLAIFFICFITMIITFVASAYTVIGVLILQRKIKNKNKIQQY